MAWPETTSDDDDYIPAFTHAGDLKSSDIVDPDPAPESDIPAKESLFVVVVDSNEQLPYTFQGIVGYTDHPRVPVNVRRARKKLVVGDYGIEGIPGISIERKSKEDLFGSIASLESRDNFLSRLRKMSTRLKYAAVVIECEAADIFDNPPEYTNYSPKSLYNTVLSWQEKFPLVHWHWCRDRDFAEQTTFRLLEKFYEDEMELRHQTDNSIIDNHVQAFRDGIIARKSFDDHPVPYGHGNPLRRSWLRGWGFYSIHFTSGDLGSVHDIDNPPPLPAASKPKRSRKKKADPNQAMLDLKKEIPEPFQF